jgi:hypothetical protein
MSTDVGFHLVLAVLCHGTAVLGAGMFELREMLVLNVPCQDPFVHKPRGRDAANQAPAVIHDALGSWRRIVLQEFLKNVYRLFCSQDMCRSTFLFIEVNIDKIHNIIPGLDQTFRAGSTTVSIDGRHADDPISPLGASLFGL